MIEIRHYVSRAGKDIFDEWLTELADGRAQAKIAARIDRLAPEISATAGTGIKGFVNCESTGVPATGFITQ